MKDYYRILQIPRDASASDIREAYRRCARATHPDVCDSENSRAFLDVQEAWEILGKPKSRLDYDRSLSNANPVARTHPEAIRPVDDVYVAKHARPAESQFDQTWLNAPLDDFAWDSGCIGLDVILTSEESNRGVAVPISISILARCLLCGGSGGYIFERCGNCRGRGLQPQLLSLCLQIPPGLGQTRVLKFPLAEFGLSHEVLLVRVRTGERTAQNLSHRR